MKKALFFVFTCLLVFACTDVDDLEKDIKDLQERMTSVEKEIETLKQSFQDAVTSIQALTTTTNQLSTDNEALKAKFDELEKAYQSIQQKVEQLEEQQDDLIASLSEQGADIDAINAELVKVKKQISDLENSTNARGFVFFPYDTQTILDSKAQVVIGNIIVDSASDIDNLTHVDYVLGMLYISDKFSGNIILPELKGVSGFIINDELKYEELRAPLLEYVDRFENEVIGGENTKVVDLRSLTSNRYWMDDVYAKAMSSSSGDLKARYRAGICVSALEEIYLNSFINGAIWIEGIESTVVELNKDLSKVSLIIEGLDIAKLFTNTTSILRLKIEECTCSEKVLIKDVIQLNIDESQVDKLEVITNDCDVEIDIDEDDNFSLAKFEAESVDLELSLNKANSLNTTIDISCFNSVAHISHLSIYHNENNSSEYYCTLNGLNGNHTINSMDINAKGVGLNILNGITELKPLFSVEEEHYTPNYTLHLNSKIEGVVFEQLLSSEATINIYFTNLTSASGDWLCSMKPYFDEPDETAPFYLNGSTVEQITTGCK